MNSSIVLALLLATSACAFAPRDRLDVHSKKFAELRAAVEDVKQEVHRLHADFLDQIVEYYRIKWGCLTTEERFGGGSCALIIPEAYRTAHYRVTLDKGLGAVSDQTRTVVE